MTKEISLRYSGFIIFAAKMISVATGIVFTLFLTREEITGITKTQFGVWANIFDLIAYFTLLAAALPFWTTRFVARGQEGATKTGVYANLIIAIIAAAVYIAIVPLATSALGIPESFLFIYFFAATEIISLYLINVLEASLRAQKPQAIGYGLLVEETVKIALAYTLMVLLHLQLLGAMISLVGSATVQVIYYLKLVSFDFKQKIRWNYIRQWMKGSAANIYYVVGNQIANFSFILLFQYGGEPARADFLAASTIANIVIYSSFLSFALYPRLLAHKSKEEITTSLKMVLMFAIPMTAVAMAIPDSFVVILNETYREAAPVLIILTIDAFIITISQFYTYTLFGIEKMDEEAKIPLRQLVRSNIFKVFTLSYVQAAIALPTVFFLLTAFAVDNPVLSSIYVSATNMILRLSMFIVLIAIVRKVIKVAIPWRQVSKYVLVASIVSVLIYVLPHPTRLVFTLIDAAGAGILYIILLAAVDREARGLVFLILQEMRSAIRKII